MGRGDSLAEDGEFKLLDSCSDRHEADGVAEQLLRYAHPVGITAAALRPSVGYLKDAVEEIH